MIKGEQYFQAAMSVSFYAKRQAKTDLPALNSLPHFTNFIQNDFATKKVFQPIKIKNERLQKLFHICKNSGNEQEKLEATKHPIIVVPYVIKGNHAMSTLCNASRWLCCCVSTPASLSLRRWRRRMFCCFKGQ